jgi:hypothetical protein
MKAVWAASLPGESAEWLAACRNVPALQVAESDGVIWVSGPDRTVLDSNVLVAVPEIQLFELDDEQRLTPIGNLLSVGRLPDLNWKSLREQVRPRLPTAGFASRQFQTVRLELERSSAERDVNVVIVGGDKLRALADTIPAARLKAWKLAVRSDGDVLVWGSALPPLEGKRFCEEAGVAFPAGLAPQPAISSAAIARQLGRRAGELLLWSSDSRIERIAAGHFTQATRVAIRLSCGRPTT